jgi:ABC-type iron transport system FetAB ATPase subunit
MKCINGSVKVTGGVSYCAQVPWIISDSVKGNITMGWSRKRKGNGREDGGVDDERYEEAVRVCALRPDLAILPAGIHLFVNI